MKMIRNDADTVKKSLTTRGKDYSREIDEILLIDEKRRELNTKADNIKCKQNQMNKEIINLKRNGECTNEIMQEMKQISAEIKEYNVEIAKLEKRQKDVLLTLPNIPHKSVPIGTDDACNKEIRKWGEPRKFDFEPKPHWDLGSALDIMDMECAAKVTGTRFNFYKGLGARLERAIVNFYLDTHTENGYKEIFPPFLANKNSMLGTGQLPKMEEDMFKLEGLDYYLIPTAEVPVTNIHREEILLKNMLPIKYCAYSCCFRAEAGSAGRDTRGLIRNHQFNKVELVKFVEPSNSYNELEKLTEDAENVLKLLNLPYRVIVLCTGDMGFCSAKTYDIEVWMPSYGRYVEISSCSNFEDFQARRAQIRFKENIRDKSQLIHTLNGSGVAVGRTFAAILENYQNEDGSITVPDVLKKFVGADIIN